MSWLILPPLHNHNQCIDATEYAGEVIAINFQRLHLILPAEEEYVELDEPLTEYPTVQKMVRSGIF